MNDPTFSELVEQAAKYGYRLVAIKHIRRLMVSHVYEPEVPEEYVLDCARSAISYALAKELRDKGMIVTKTHNTDKYSIVFGQTRISAIVEVIVP